MRVLSLVSQIEECIAEAEHVKNLSGNIKSLDTLFKPENLALLEQNFRCFAFLAFHPATDQVITDYVKAGSLALDSGPNIMTLFALDAEATWPQAITDDSFKQWIDIDTSKHPAYEMVRMFFEPLAVPPLPGIIFFPSFIARQEVIYIPLQKLADVQAVREQLRMVFMLADKAARASHAGGGFAEKLALTLQQQRIPFVKVGTTTAREWLVRAYQFLGDHFGDLVSTIGLFK